MAYSVWQCWCLGNSTNAVSSSINASLRLKPDLQFSDDEEFLIKLVISACLFIFFLCRKALATNCHRRCHQRDRIITGCWGAYGYYNHSAGAQDKKQKQAVLVRRLSLLPRRWWQSLIILWFHPGSPSFSLSSMPSRDSPSKKLPQPIRKRPADDVQVTSVTTERITRVLRLRVPSHCCVVAACNMHVQNGGRKVLRKELLEK